MVCSIDFEDEYKHVGRPLFRRAASVESTKSFMGVFDGERELSRHKSLGQALVVGLHPNTSAAAAAPPAPTRV